GARDLGASRADEPGERDDLAAAHDEGHIGELPLPRERIALTPDRPWLGLDLREQRVHVTTHHRADHGLDGQLADRLRPDVATVAHHRDALSDPDNTARHV